MTTDPAFVRRGTDVLLPDSRRVISRPFLVGEQMSAAGLARVDGVIQRILALTDAEVADALATAVQRFSGRHHDLPGVFARHFTLVADRVPAAVSTERRDLIGAYFTQEYSVEAAALFNPSIVVHPDQTGLAAGQLRFIMSVRAVGEGHISSIEFRTGIISGDKLGIDDPGRHLVTGRATPAPISREFLRDAAAEQVDMAAAGDIIDLLPAQFDLNDFDAAVGSAPPDAIVEYLRWLVSCNYQLRFDAGRPIAERVIFPVGPDETNGVEDARFTHFVDADGSSTYFATYTAFDGSRITPRLVRTDDFETFTMTRVTGPAATNKGMALFPRRVGGRYLALSRWDQESIGVASSTDAHTWGDPVTVAVPEQSWELIQLGNCGSPIETPDGWLVLTHGVGPMRTYGIGAMLLDLAEPTTVIGVLSQPMITAYESERDGYVPNVVYSCGALAYEQTLVVPYGCSDSAIRFAFVDLPELLKQLRSSAGER